MTIVNVSDIFGKFFDVKFFYSQEFHTRNVTVGDIPNTRVLHLVNKIDATENKHLLEIYAVVNQVTLRPLVSTFCRGLSESNVANLQ